MGDGANSLSRLNELAQKYSVQINYRTEKVSGSQHCPVFRCSIVIRDEIHDQAVAGNKSEAKRLAADSFMSRPNVESILRPSAWPSALLAPSLHRNVAIIPPETRNQSSASHSTRHVQYDDVLHDLLKLNRYPSISDLKNANPSAVDTQSFIAPSAKSQARLKDDRTREFLISLLDFQPKNPFPTVVESNTGPSSPADQIIIQAHKLMRNDVQWARSLMVRQLHSGASLLAEATDHLRSLGLLISCDHREYAGGTCLIRICLHDQSHVSSIGLSRFGREDAEKDALINVLTSMVVPNLQVPYSVLNGHCLS